MKKLGCLFLIPVVGIGLLFLGIMMTITGENDSNVNEEMTNDDFSSDGEYRFNGVSPEIERYRPFLKSMPRKMESKIIPKS